jgi:formate-dependent nitrite reductase membrane component NrfD
MPDVTSYALHPEWGGYIVAYFYLGGIAAGAYFMAAIIELIGNPEDRALARTAYYIAFPLVVICGILLILDLGRPERFWHMLIYSKAKMPIFKYWSPMSVGAWALLIFGGFTFLSFIDALVESHQIKRGKGGERLIYTGFLGKGFAFIGSLFGFFIASYTGALLTATNQPIWSQTSLLGALFLASSASTGMAALLLIHNFRRHRIETRDGSPLQKLEQADNWTMLLELILIGLLIFTLGQNVAAPLIRGHYGKVLWVGVVLLGIVLPLILHAFPILGTRGSEVLAALLILLGGFLLRYVFVMAPQGLYFSFLKSLTH